MPHKFFISHYSGDKDIAEVFSNALKDITLGQINPWFSSDSNGNDGLRPGDLWFNQILAKITDSKAVVAILTPNSINRPWIYFESGIAQALEGCDVIPVCIGVKRDSILPPLGLYQCYQLNDYRSVVDFFSKLLSLFEIRFEQSRFKDILEKIVSDISKITFDIDKADKEESFSDNVIQDLKSHIDKRFIELLERPAYAIQGDNLNIKIDRGNKALKRLKEPESAYSVLFAIDFPLLRNKIYIDIREDDVFQNITDSLYFNIREYVNSYTYLEEWMIVNASTNKRVIIREIAYLIPAKSIFKPDTEWKVILLDEPYNATQSAYY